MKYEEFVADFAERTFENLMLVCDKKTQSGEGYEVTQLINSFTGLLIFPKEKDKKEDLDSWKKELIEFPKHSKVEQAYDAGVNAAPHGEYYRPSGSSKYFRLVYHLRNAVAHENVVVHDSHIGPMSSVEGFKFTDYNPNNKEQEISFVLHNEDIYAILTDLLGRVAPTSTINDSDIQRCAKHFAKKNGTETPLKV